MFVIRVQFIIVSATRVQFIIGSVIRVMRIIFLSFSGREGVWVRSFYCFGGK